MAISKVNKACWLGLELGNYWRAFGSDLPQRTPGQGLSLCQGFGRRGLMKSETGEMTAGRSNVVGRSGSSTVSRFVDKVPCPAHRGEDQKGKRGLVLVKRVQGRLAKDAVWPARARVRLHSDKAQEAGLISFTGSKESSANPTQVHCLILLIPLVAILSSELG